MVNFIREKNLLSFLLTICLLYFTRIFSTAGLLNAIHYYIPKMGKPKAEKDNSNLEKSFSPTFSTLEISSVDSGLPCTYLHIELKLHISTTYLSTYIVHTKPSSWFSSSNHPFGLFMY